MSEHVSCYSRLNNEEQRQINVFDELAKQAIRQALQISGGNVTHAAERLGIYRQTLQRKMKLLGLR